MLAATAMVAVLAGSLYASLHIAFKARQTASAAAEAVRKCNLTLELIQADLESAVIPSGTLAGPFLGSSSREVPGAVGDATSFYAVVADLEPRPGAGDVKKIEYSCQLSPEGDQLILVRRLTTNLLAPQTPEPQEEVICRGLSAFVLRYFDGWAWQDNWDSATQSNALPLAVEVSLEWKQPAAGAAPRVSRVVLLPCGQDSSGTQTTGEAP
jgi:type II secretory pathway component PulJ